MKTLAPLIVLLLTSCVTHPKPKTPAQAGTVRKLLRQHVQGAGDMSSVDPLPANPPQRQITITWENAPGMASWATGLVATTDLASWYEVARLPYQAGSVSVTLTNRPPCEFYRTFNSVNNQTNGP